MSKVSNPRVVGRHILIDVKKNIYEFLDVIHKQNMEILDVEIKRVKKKNRIRNVMGIKHRPLISAVLGDKIDLNRYAYELWENGIDIIEDDVEYKDNHFLRRVSEIVEAKNKHHNKAYFPIVSSKRQIDILLKIKNPFCIVKKPMKTNLITISEIDFNCTNQVKQKLIAGLDYDMFQSEKSSFNKKSKTPFIRNVYPTLGFVLKQKYGNNLCLSCNHSIWEHPDGHISGVTAMISALSIDKFSLKDNPALEKSFLKWG